MIKNIPVILFLIVLVSCAEPYEFDTGRVPLVVVDAKVSTQTGQSFVSIHSIDVGGEANALPNLEVIILDGNGLEHSFYFHSDSNKYFPSQPDFQGVIGHSYRMEAQSKNGIFFRSESEVISSPYSFDIVAKDTSQQYLTELNIIQEREGVAAIAVIPPLSEEVYSKLTFKYSYLNVATSQREEVSYDDYVLHACSNQTKCSDTVSVSVGMRLNLPWKFYEKGGSCPLEPDQSTPCALNPCCTSLQSWKADFEIVQETLTPEAFQYLRNVKRLTNNNGLILDTYPFQLIGNVECENCEKEVVGIFRAVAESSAIIEVVI